MRKTETNKIVTKWFIVVRFVADNKWTRLLCSTESMRGLINLKSIWRTDIRHCLLSVHICRVYFRIKKSKRQKHDIIAFKRIQHKKRVEIKCDTKENSIEMHIHSFNEWTFLLALERKWFGVLNGMLFECKFYVLFVYDWIYSSKTPDELYDLRWKCTCCLIPLCHSAKWQRFDSLRSFINILSNGMISNCLAPVNMIECVPIESIICICKHHFSCHRCHNTRANIIESIHCMYRYNRMKIMNIRMK